MSTNRWQWVAVITFLAMLAICAGFIVYYLVIDSRPPVYEVYSHPAPVNGPVKHRQDIIEKRQVRAGDEIFIYRESCWTRQNVAGKIKRAIMLDNKVVLVFPVIPAVNGVLGCQGITGVLQLPPILPPAPYTLQASIDFEPNPLTTITVKWGDVSFEVVK